MNGGWIKLYRKVADNPVIMKDADHLAIWIYLLLNATHDDYSAVFKGEKITLKPGQLITGRRKISETLLIHESKVTRVLNAFESEQQIEQQTGNKNRLISIVNWEMYQLSEQQTEQQMNNKRTTDEQQANNKRTTSEQQVNNKRTTSEHKQEQKNIRTKEYNIKNNIGSLDINEQVRFPENQVLSKAFYDFVEMRKKTKKPMTERAKELLLQKLTKLASVSGVFDETLAAEILDQSTINCWQSVYPLKTDNNNSETKRRTFNSFQQNEYDFKELEKELTAN